MQIAMVTDFVSGGENGMYRIRKRFDRVAGYEERGRNLFAIEQAEDALDANDV